MLNCLHTSDLSVSQGAPIYDNYVCEEYGLILFFKNLNNQINKKYSFL